jgi:hypothetical protein
MWGLLNCPLPPVPRCRDLRGRSCTERGLWRQDWSRQGRWQGGRSRQVAYWERGVEARRGSAAWKRGVGARRGSAAWERGVRMVSKAGIVISFV